MVRAVDKDSLDAYDREASEKSLLYAVLKSLFNGREVVLRNCAAEYSFFKYKVV